jgi:hypothetical protein
MSAGLIPGLFKKSAFEWSTLPRKGALIKTAKRSFIHSANLAWGGPGAVTGTVKIGSTAVKRRVRLYEAGTGILIREAWSADDGSYSFPGLKTAYKYTVTATDYSGAYNDVIAANVTAV